MAPKLATECAAESKSLAGLTTARANAVQREVQDLMPGPWKQWFPKVAISYATGMRPGVDVRGAGPGMLQAAAIMHALHDKGIGCASGLCVPAGANWKEFLPKIESRFSNCEVLIVLLSPAFYRSHPCLLEVHQASQAKKMRIIPLRCEEGLPKADEQWPDIDADDVMVLDQVQKTLGALNALPPRGRFFDNETYLDELVSQVAETLGLTSRPANPLKASHDSSDAAPLETDSVRLFVNDSAALQRQEMERELATARAKQAEAEAKAKAAEAAEAKAKAQAQAAQAKAAAMAKVDLSGNWYSVERATGKPNGDRYSFKREGGVYKIYRQGKSPPNDHFTVKGNDITHKQGPKAIILPNGDVHWDIEKGKWLSRREGSSLTPRAPPAEPQALAELRGVDGIVVPATMDRGAESKPKAKPKASGLQATDLNGCWCTQGFCCCIPVCTWGCVEAKSKDTFKAVVMLGLCPIVTWWKRHGGQGSNVFEGFTDDCGRPKDKLCGAMRTVETRDKMIERGGPCCCYTHTRFGT